jgi:hypothetical protein
MDLETIRQQSLKTASQLGFNVAASLPLLDKPEREKSADEIIARLVCLHAAAACAYGFDRCKARQWLDQENAVASLSQSERDFIDRGIGDPNRFKVQIEGMWAMAWALGLVARLDFAKDCDSKFAVLLPNLKIAESTASMRSKTKLRALPEILAAADLAYCLHWTVREAQIAGQKSPGKVQPYVIVERRRALDWIVGADEWEEVSLDT